MPRASWQRWGVLTLTALVLSGDGYSGPGQNSSFIDDVAIIRVADDAHFDGLVALLWDHEVESDLTSTLPALSLWSLTTTVVPASPEEGCSSL